MRIGLSLLLAVASIQFSFSQNNGGLKELTSAQWQEDLQTVSKTIKSKHKNPFHHTTEAEFDKQVKSLNDRIPEMEAPEILIGLMKTAAMIGDGHTAVWGFRQTMLFPIHLYWFGMDLRVTGTRDQETEVLGWKVVRIDNTPVLEAMEKIKPLIAGDENSNYVVSWSQYWLKNADGLHAQGVTKTPDKVTYTLQNDEGSEKTITLEAVSRDTYGEIDFKKVYDPLPSFFNEDKAIWTELLQGSKTLYVNWNTYPGWKDMKSFAKEIQSQVVDNDVNKLIIDFRTNGGGNFDMGLHLIKLLKKTQLASTGKIYVLTSRATFSAAMSNTSHFKYQMNAILVGEAPGERPNGYAENHSYTLPNSGITASCSIRYYEFWTEDIPMMIMDKEIAPDFSAWKEGRDPVLEWVLEN